jgi:hypothetical protein
LFAAVKWEGLRECFGCCLFPGLDKDKMSGCVRPSVEMVSMAESAQIYDDHSWTLLP